MVAPRTLSAPRVKVSGRIWPVNWFLATSQRIPSEQLRQRGIVAARPPQVISSSSPVASLLRSGGNKFANAGNYGDLRNGQRDGRRYQAPDGLGPGLLTGQRCAAVRRSTGCESRARPATGPGHGAHVPPARRNADLPVVVTSSAPNHASGPTITA
jgi:hypothetical protein